MAAAMETAPGKRKRLAVITTGDFDQERLTYRHGGRDDRLTDVHGHVVKEVLVS